jgi:mannosyltransferase
VFPAVPIPAHGSTVAERLLVLLCVAIGAVLRFTPATPLWLDEALSVNIAKAPLGDIAGLLERDGHPPLYYWMLHGWIELFGDGPVAVRSLSAVFGLIAIGLVFVLGRRLGGPALGLVAAAVLAVSPYGVRYSSEARMYELVVVFVLVGWLLLDVALRRTPRAAAPALAGLAVVSGALLLTHYWAAFLLAAVVAGLALAAYKGFTAFTRSSLLAAAVALCAGGLFFLPWLSTMRYQAEHTGTPWAPPARPTRVASESLTEFTGGLYPESILLAATLVALVLLAVFGHRAAGGVLLGKPATDWRAAAGLVLAGTAAIGAAAAVVTDSAFAGRYASVYFPMFVLLVAAGVVLVAGWARVAVLATVVLLSLAAIVIQMVRYDRSQVGEIAAAIEAQVQPGDIVVVCPDQLGPALSRLVEQPGVRVVRYPDLGDARFVDWVDYADRYATVDPLAAAEAVLAEAGDNTIWLNWSDGYRVVGSQCTQFATHLITRRPGSAPLVSGDSVKYALEWSSVIRLTPPPATP